MGRLLRNGVLFTLLFACLTPARADPILMLLMSVAREMMDSRLNARPAEAAPVLPAPDRFYPGTTVEPETLRGLIDISFPYLSDAQRREVFDALNAQLT